MVVHLGELDEFVKDRILEPLDESYLNDQPQFQNVVPTTENLCLEIHRILRESWHLLPSAQQAQLERVRLEETSSNFFEYRGDGAGTGLSPSPM
jgi:6-pyruvoyltetrahydropterin/6-carboxytetrahydropterin synthase